MHSKGVTQCAHPSWRATAGSLTGPLWAPPRPQGQGRHHHPGLPPGWSSEEVDWNYLVQWFLTCARQLKLICHCSLASQGAPVSSKQMQKGNSILLQTRSPTKAAQWTKGPPSVAAGMLGRREGKGTVREGSSVVERVTEKHL